MFLAPKGETEFPIAEPEENATPTPRWTERWGLMDCAYVSSCFNGICHTTCRHDINAPPGSPPFITW